MSKRDFNAISISSDSDDERPDEKFFKNEIQTDNEPSTSSNSETIDMKQKSISDLLKVRFGSFLEHSLCYMDHDS